jgi:hypothetical protein
MWSSHTWRHIRQSGQLARTASGRYDGPAVPPEPATRRQLHDTATPPEPEANRSTI